MALPDLKSVFERLPMIALAGFTVLLAGCGASELVQGTRTELIESPPDIPAPPLSFEPEPETAMPSAPVDEDEPPQDQVQDKAQDQALAEETLPPEAAPEDAPRQPASRPTFPAGISNSTPVTRPAGSPGKGQTPGNIPQAVPPDPPFPGITVKKAAPPKADPVESPEPAPAKTAGLKPLKLDTPKQPALQQPSNEPILEPIPKPAASSDAGNAGSANSPGN